MNISFLKTSESRYKILSSLILAIWTLIFSIVMLIADVALYGHLNTVVHCVFAMGIVFIFSFTGMLLITKLGRMFIALILRRQKGEWE